MSDKTTKNEMPVNKGNLIPSTNKSNDDAPDFFGKFNFPFGLFELSAWKKRDKDGNLKYIAVQVDEAALSIDDRKTRREKLLADYLKEKKANPDEFLLMDRSGTFNVAKADADEDLFGSIMIDGDTYHVKAFASLSQSGNDYFRLEMSTGKLNKDLRRDKASKLLA